MYTFCLFITVIKLFILLKSDALRPCRSNHVAEEDKHLKKYKNINSLKLKFRNLMYRPPTKYMASQKSDRMTQLKYLGCRCELVCTYFENGTDRQTTRS